MQKVFFTRSKGRVKKMLTVYSDGTSYKLHYVTLDRTNPSAEERAQGIKEKRFETLNREFSLKKGEELVLSSYPQPELTQQFKSFLESTEGNITITDKPSPAQVVAARVAAKMTQREAAEMFGIGVNAWQKKEADGPSHRDLSVGEYNYLLMLANEHPEFLAIRRLPKDKNLRQDAAQLAYELAQYLSSGDYKEIVLPSAVDAKMKILQDKVNELRAEWESDIDFRR